MLGFVHEFIFSYTSHIHVSVHSIFISWSRATLTWSQIGSDSGQFSLCRPFVFHSPVNKPCKGFRTQLLTEAEDLEPRT